MTLVSPPLDPVVAGHAPTVTAVVESIRHGKAAHAYLLVGPSGVGKAAVARHVAAVLMCPTATPPCGTCSPCLQLARGVHPDVTWLQRELNERSGLRRRQYGLDAVRDLIVRLSRTSGSGWQVAVIPDAEALGSASANALLKTLEEPAPGVVFLLTARHPQLLPATVVSRCAVVRLHPQPTARLARQLAEGGIPPAEAQAVAHLSGGLPATAWQLASDPQVRQLRLETAQQFLRIWTAPLTQRLGLVAELSAAAQAADDERSAATCVDDWLVQWSTVVRDFLLLRLGLRALVRHSSDLAALDRAADGYHPQALAAFAEQVQASRGYLAANANVRLVLENLFLTAPPTPVGSPTSV